MKCTCGHEDSSHRTTYTNVACSECKCQRTEKVEATAEKKAITFTINAPMGDAVSVGRVMREAMAAYYGQGRTFRQLGLVGWLRRAWRRLLARSQFLGGART